jgi:lysyl-tRNA synthetase class 2
VTDARLERLRQRAAVVKALRRVLDERGFTEVQPPLLSPATCPDVALDSFEVTGGGYLVTSTEYHLKRLAAAGLGSAYSLTQNFRRGEVSDRHNPEFTMLEWYRVGAPLDLIELDAEALLRAALDAVDAPQPPPFGHVTVRAAIEARTGYLVDAGFSHEALVRAVDVAGWDVDRSIRHDRHALLSLLVAEAQAVLGFDAPVFVVDWPVLMTSSAQPHPTDPMLALRSELVWRGVELSDGFPFLVDAARQRALFDRELQQRLHRELAVVALDEAYLAMLEAGLPQGAGMALGVDRLVMLATGAERVSEVMAFGWSER